MCINVCSYSKIGCKGTAFLPITQVKSVKNAQMVGKRAHFAASVHLLNDRFASVA
jgi:hypothetical protein